MVDQPAEHLDGRPLRPHDRVADHARDDLVVADPPEVDPLVELGQRLGELVELLVLAAVDVDVDEREPGLLAERVECLPERGRDAGGSRRQPGESKPLPCPSTLRISWYSQGDMCSSMSSCVVA